LVEVCKRDLNDFEQFEVLFLFEKSDLENFVYFTPKYLLPIVAQPDFRCVLAITQFRRFVQINNLGHNLPHQIKISAFIQLPVIFLLGPVLIVMNRFEVLSVLMRVVIQLDVRRSVLRLL
jgi:hypothetical protein